jgi:hypothetical protein
MCLWNLKPPGSGFRRDQPPPPRHSTVIEVTPGTTVKLPTDGNSSTACPQVGEKYTAIVPKNNGKDLSTSYLINVFISSTGIGCK